MAKKLTYNFVSEEFRKRGHRLISTKYYNSYLKLDFICPNGHNGAISWDSFKQGHGCSKCYGNRPNEFNVIKKEFNYYGYLLKSTGYKGAHSKLKCLCPDGHKWEISWNNFRRGVRCSVCMGLKKKTIEFITEEFEKEGYVNCSSEYSNAFQKLDFICPNGHNGKIRWNNFQQGQRCSLCSCIVSRAEEEIFNFVFDILKEGDTIRNTRLFIPPYELDIYIPSKKLAIEYCGLYWHSEKMGKDKYYHRRKYDLCKEKGIRLLTIFEDEYLKNKDFVFKRIKEIIKDINVVFPEIQGGCILSDLRWDGKEAKSRYLQTGYSLVEERGPQVYSIKNDTKVWDCGCIIYNKRL